MKRSFSTIPFIIFLFLSLSLISIPVVFPQEDVSELKKQIETLKKRVDELEAQQTQQPVIPYEQDRWDPFAEMESIQQEMDQMFGQAFSGGGNSPGGMFTTDMVFDRDLNFKETDQGYEIRFDMAGLDKEKMDIQIKTEQKGDELVITMPKK